MRLIYCTLLTLFGYLALLGQEPVLHIKMYTGADTVLLRWAPSDAQIWHAGNKYGYFVERFEIATKADTLHPPILVLLTPTPLLPAPESALDTLDEEDEYTAIVLSAIYGHAFEPISPLENLKGYKDYDQELQTRFGFALLSADLSQIAAKAHGLFLADRVPDTTKRYAYRISIADSSQSISPAVILYEKERKNIEPIPALQAQFADSTTTLHWDKQWLQNHYSGYFIERSDDKGKAFRKINLKPIVPINNEVQADRVFYVDTLPELLKEYQYRIRGINSFGRLGPPSNIVSGQGVPEFTIQAYIDSIVSLPNQTVYLSWKLDGKDEASVNGFDILRSDSLHGSWQKLNKSPLKPAARSFVDKQPIAYGYYRVKSYGIHGGFTLSYTRVGMVIDSVPPSAPRQLAGTVDTSGVVRLQWEASPEADVKGYRLFRGNTVDEQIEITDSLCTGTAFTDTINISISPFVYYRVSATDVNFNRSALSEPVRIARPDTVPPTHVLITNLRESNDSITFRWIASPSPDVDFYRIFRVQEETEDTTLLDKLSAEKVKDENQYIDLKAHAGARVHYYIQIVDQSGNSSGARSGSLTTGNGLLPPVENLKAVVDRKNKCIWLSWECKSKEVAKYILFRSKNSDAILRLKEISAGTNQFKDLDVDPNNQYNYYIQIFDKSYNLSTLKNSGYVHY